MTVAKGTFRMEAMEMRKPALEKRFLLPLILGGVLQALPVLCLGNEILTVLSSLLWPAFFLLASRRAGSRRQFLLTMAVLAGSKYLRYMLTFGLSPLYLALLFALTLVITLFESVAFGVDRLLIKKGIPHVTLVFPLLYTAAMCLVTALNLSDLTNPAAALGYMSVFSQGASLLLEHGLCFLMMLVISLICTAIDSDRSRRGVYSIITILILVLLLVFGLFRLAARKEPEERIRVALATSYYDAFDSIASDKTEEAYYTLVEKELSEAAKQGAELVVFTEEHACVGSDSLPAWQEKVSALVQSYGIPVLLPIEVTTPEGERNINEAILFDKTGKPLFTYVKNNLVPFLESSDYVNGPEQVGMADLEIGGTVYRVAVAICFDSNDAAFLRKTTADADILLCPSWEWFSCNWEQERTVRLRAIENKLTVIKATQDGFHIVADPYGIILYSEDTVGKYETVSIVDIPVYNKAQGITVAAFQRIDSIASCELFCAMMILILIGATIFQMAHKDRKTRFYLGCLATTLLGLLFDAFSFIFDGSHWSNITSFVVNLGAYLFVDYILISFALYFKALLSDRNGRSLWLALVALLFPLIDSFVLLYTAFTGSLFSVVNGTFVPGVWDGYVGVIPAIGILFVFATAARNKSRLKSREYSAVILYIVLPFLASLMVAIVGGTSSLSYLAVSLSMLILYVLIQSGVIERGLIREQVLQEISLLDQLTGLGNRRAYDMRLSEYKQNTSIAAIFCDVNNLKETNDTQGHRAGDDLLLRFAALLKQHFDRDDIFRISGDEFVILLSDAMPEKAEQLFKEFYEDLKKNSSIAAAGWGFGSDGDPLDIVKLAEKNMYEDKRIYHERTGTLRR